MSLPDTWKYEPNYLWRYNGDNCSPKEVHVMLHGANIGNTSGGPTGHAEHMEEFGQVFLDYCDETDAVIILPDSGVLQTDDGPIQQTWDWTGYFSHDKEASNIVSLLSDSRQIAPKVWFHGGSAGGVMAWKVATALEQAGSINVIQGLVMAEAISPYSTSAIHGVPVNFKGIPSQYEWDVFGFDFYSSDDIDAQMSFPNSSVTWPKQTLLQYSVEDPIIPEEWKEDFAIKLGSRATALTTHIVGTGHDLGEQGWQNTVDWLRSAT